MPQSRFARWTLRTLEALAVGTNLSFVAFAALIAVLPSGWIEQNIRHVIANAVAAFVFGVAVIVVKTRIEGGQQ